MSKLGERSDDDCLLSSYCGVLHMLWRAVHTWRVVCTYCGVLYVLWRAVHTFVLYIRGVLCAHTVACCMHILWRAVHTVVCC